VVWFLVENFGGNIVCIGRHLFDDDYEMKT
jgi:hypothetical protein